jgi:hypothetical protein
MRRCLSIELGAAVVLALAMLSIAPAGGRASQPKGAQGLSAALRADMEKSRADLAVSKRFYLELRVADKTIALCHSGVDLAQYPFDRIQIGCRRILGIQRGVPGAWIGLTLRRGTLAPAQVLQRVNIVPGDEATVPTPEVPGIVPPTMTEIMPVPRSFRMRFGNELAVQVELAGKIPGAADRTGGRWSSHWQAFLEALGARPSPRVQLRIEMSAEAGAALYRCFPESPSMLVSP